jgi:hypothetical protein
MFGKTKVAAPTVGDVFVKVADGTRTTWVIAKTFVHVDGIEHAVLHRHDRPNDIITVSVPALADSDLFQRVPKA